MTLILIIFCIWGVSALARATKEAARQREIERQRKEKEQTARMIALEREQMRQAREQEKLAKEQEKQAEVLRRHEERLLRLEQKLELAQREEEHYSDEVTAITIDMSGVKAYVDYMKDRGLPCKGKEAELEKLGRKLYAAETKLIKARQARELCEKQMEVA